MRKVSQLALVGLGLLYVVHLAVIPALSKMGRVNGSLLERQYLVKERY